MQGIPCIFERFPLLSHEFKWFGREENPCFFGGFTGFFLPNNQGEEDQGTMRVEIIAYMIYSEGPEYPEYVMHFLPKVFRESQISEYVRQILSQSMLLSKQNIAQSIRAPRIQEYVMQFVLHKAMQEYFR